MLPAQVARDLQLLNLPKYATKQELKKAYHKFAKQFHPDLQRNISPEALNRQEDKFKALKSSYERLDHWMEHRDVRFDEFVSSSGSSKTVDFG